MSQRPFLEVSCHASWLSYHSEQADDGPFSHELLKVHAVVADTGQVFLMQVIARDANPLSILHGAVQGGLRCSSALCGCAHHRDIGAAAAAVAV